MREFTVLHIVAQVIVILGFVFLLGSVAGVIYVVSNTDQGRFATTIGLEIAGGFFGLGIVTIAQGQLLQVILQIEQNTRKY